MTRSAGRRTAVGAFTLAMALAACSDGGVTSGVTSESAAPGAAPGTASAAPGVTADSITLGELTDLTGPFSSSGRSITNAQTLYFDQVNASGGICGRKVRLLIRDHGYDVDRAVTAYTETQPQVLGYVQLFGSSTTAALLTNITSDTVLTIPASWDSALLKNPYIAVMGTTYDVEMIDAIDYLVRKEGIRSGDTIGHVVVDNDYGANGLLGSRHAAAELGLKVKEVTLAPDAEDVTGAVTALKTAGVKAVLVTTGPQQAAAVVRTAASLGLDVPVVGNSPSYSPALLRTPAAAALRARFRVVTSAAPFSTGLPDVKRVAAAYTAKYPQATPDSSVIFGYGAARVFATALKQACTDHDLTRDGVVDAFRAMSAVETGGLVPRLDFSRPGAPSAREVYVSRPDPDSAGGLRVVELPFASAVAMGYRAPAQG